jgi:hypothetical protein
MIKLMDKTGVLPSRTHFVGTKDQGNIFFLSLLVLCGFSLSSFSTGVLSDTERENYSKTNLWYFTFC